MNAKHNDTAMSLTQLQQRLGELSEWLERWRAVWSSSAFQEQPVDWEAGLPELSAWLRARSLDEIETHEAAPHRHPSAHPQLVAWAQQSEALVHLAPWTGEPGPTAASATAASPTAASPTAARGARPPRRVSTRKWAQIQRFITPLLTLSPAEPVDWCAGKGHLGRSLGLALGHTLTPGGTGRVHAIERDAHLCDVGQDLARRAGVHMRFVAADVMTDPPADVVRPGRTLIGLHACGDLSVRALTLGPARDCAGVAIAGCCYHRISGSHHLPLSAAGRALDLKLCRDELRLPASQEVVASARMRRLRRREMRFRLVVDRLLREQSGVDEYTTLKSVPESWSNGPLVDFVTRLSDRDELALAPTALQLDQALTWANERARLTRALGMTRAAFRRPLELWIALDRALYLAELGWSVRLGTFCPHTLTPRNILLTGQPAPPMRAPIKVVTPAAAAPINS